jgi:hypothetical protein
MKTGINVLLCVVACGTLSACGKTNILKTIDLQVSEQNQQQFVTLSAKMNLGNAVFDQLQVPIRDPQTGIEVGSLALNTGADGMQTVSLGVNASVALHADRTLGSTLPNGRELPVTLGAAAGEMLAFPILQYSRVYIGGDLKNKAYLGVALAVKQLDGVANLAGSAANVFFGLQVSPAVYGVAGIYGSPNANQSGIAVFARAQLQPAPASGGTVLTMASQAAAAARVNASSGASAQKSPAAGLAGQISDQATSDADELHPRSERKVTNFFYGNRRVIKVQ